MGGMVSEPAARSIAAFSRQSRDRISDSIERVTSHNADTGFCVMRLKAKGQRDLVTLTGHAAAIGAGEYRGDRCLA